MQTITTRSEEETIRFGAQIGQSFKQGAVVALVGPLGAGKTTMIRGMCRGMGFGGDVTSPTFNLMNVYHGGLKIHHFDLYRLGEKTELDDLGYEEYFYPEKGVTLIEWAERAADYLPKTALVIEIELVSENERRITLAPAESYDLSNKQFD